MKDKRAIFVKVQGDRRIERVEFGVEFRFYLPCVNNDVLWSATSKLRDVIDQAKTKLMDCFVEQTTEKVLWTIGRPHPAVVEDGPNKTWTEVKQLIDFTLAIPSSFMGKDCAIVEISTVLIKAYSMLFDWIGDLNKNIFDDLKPRVNRAEREISNIGCRLQTSGFRCGDGKWCYSKKTLVNFGID